MKARLLVIWVLLLLFLPVLRSQALVILGPAQAIPGASVSFTFRLVRSASNIVATQATYSAGGLPVSVVTSPSVASIKSTFCGVGASPICLLFGVLPAPTIINGAPILSPASVFNATPIPNGTPLQIVTFQVPPSAVVGSTIIVSAAGTLACDASALAVPLQGAAVVLMVISPVALVQQSLGAWLANPSAYNFRALVAAINLAAAPH